MRILFICKDNPFGIGGGNFATRAYLQSLSDLSGGNIDVFLNSGIIVDPSINVSNYYFTKERSAFNRLSALWTGYLHRHVDVVKKKLAETGVQYTHCVFNNIKTTTGLIDEFKRRGIKTVTIHHNVETEYERDNTANALIRKPLLRIVGNAERNAFKNSDFNLFLTKQDMEAFHKMYGDTEGKEAVIGTYEFKQLPAWDYKEVDANHLVFAITGSLCTVQGVDGIKYFFEDLYQSLPKGSKVIISGRQPTQTVVEFCNHYNNVQLIPDPDDMGKVINQADIYICPTRLGGGLKLRVMDGLKLGIPVISHTCSARGYDDFIEGGFLSVFSNAKEFSEAINNQVELLRSGKLNRKVVREKYEKIFAYEAGLDRMKKALQL